jgi:hypothetical protein
MMHHQYDGKQAANNEDSHEQLAVLVSSDFQR